MADRMGSKGLTKELMYLLVGDDMDRICKSTVEMIERHSVVYFRVEDAFVIRGAKYYCSCSDEVCWHILRVILEVDHAKPQKHILYSIVLSGRGEADGCGI